MSKLHQLQIFVKKKMLLLFNLMFSRYFGEPWRTSKFQLPMSNWTRFFQTKAMVLLSKGFVRSTSQICIFADLDTWAVSLGMNGSVAGDLMSGDRRTTRNCSPNGPFIWKNGCQRTRTRILPKLDEMEVSSGSKTTRWLVTWLQQILQIILVVKS